MRRLDRRGFGIGQIQRRPVAGFHEASVSDHVVRGRGVPRGQVNPNDSWPVRKARDAIQQREDDFCESGFADDGGQSWIRWTSRSGALGGCMSTPNCDRAAAANRAMKPASNSINACIAPRLLFQPLDAFAYAPKFAARQITGCQRSDQTPNHPGARVGDTGGTCHGNHA